MDVMLASGIVVWSLLHYSNGLMNTIRQSNHSRGASNHLALILTEALAYLATRIGYFQYAHMPKNGSCLNLVELYILKNGQNFFARYKNTVNLRKSTRDGVFSPIFRYLTHTALQLTVATSKRCRRWNYFNAIKTKLLMQIVHENFIIIIKINHPAWYN